MEFETLGQVKQCVKKNKSTNENDDFSHMLVDLFKKINVKIAIFIFLIGIFVFSDLFIEIFLNKFNGAVDGHETTTKGTMIQLMMISVSYIILDLLVQGEFL